MTYKSQRKLFSAERYMMEKNGGAPVHHAVPDVDNKEILQAIAELKAMIEGSGLNVGGPAVGGSPPASAPKSVDLPEVGTLRGQLSDLKASIDKTKSEIAALHKPGQTEDKFTNAAMELDAIVQATEVATNNILGAGEDIDDFVRLIKERITDVKSHDHLDSISNLVIAIFENCNFQDVTGQRIGKVVNTINYLEERILTMIDIWGEEEFVGIELAEDARTEDEKLLEGPQLDGLGISQNDIDSLFD